MDFERYIGFKLEDVKAIMEKKGIKYKVIEVWDTKRTKMGNDLRIIKIEEKEEINIYVSFF